MRFWATKDALNHFPSVWVRLQKKWGIYRLIFRVSALPGQLSVFDHTRCHQSHSCKNFLHHMGIIAFERKTCVRAHILQNWPKLVKCDFVDIRDSFPKTPRSPQSELYNSRYGRFGGSHRVRIIAQLNFVAKAPRTVLSPKFNGISSKCNLTTCKTLKHQN
jgi:hypothetical protein